MLTVGDLLNTKALEGIKLVAGRKGIQNPIAIVNIIENPEIFDWLTPNEFILSTGYIFKDNPNLQKKIIRELAEINCAGLCVKMKRYFDSIPKEMIDLADELGLPILELPFEYTLSNVIAVINEKTNSDYDTINRKSLDLHNSLFKITLEGGGIDQISSVLAETIQNPVVILDQDWNLLYYTDVSQNETPLKDFFTFKKNKPLFPKEFTDTIPKYVGELHKSIKRIFLCKEKEFNIRIKTVVVGKSIYAYIAVFQMVRKLEKFDYEAIEQVSTILALDRMKTNEIEAVRLKIKQDFFEDLLSGKISSDKTLQTFSDLHGLKMNNAYYCLVLNIEQEDANPIEEPIYHKKRMENIHKKSIEILNTLSSRIQGEVTCYSRNRQLIIMIGSDAKKKQVPISEKKQFTTLFIQLLEEQIPQIIFRMGIGRQYGELQSIHKSYHEANEALRMMQRFKEKKSVSHFEEYYLYHFLDSHINRNDMKHFFNFSLERLHQYDQSFGTDLIGTLECYFDHNQNVSLAAKELFIHRNTFIYRIEKIKEILQVDFNNSENLLQIQIALKFYRLFHHS